MFVAVPNNLPVFNFALFYDIHRCINTNAPAHDRTEVNTATFFVYSRSLLWKITSKFDFHRSVSEEERSFALGMQFVIFRLFGYIPAPILFGNLIDSTCLLWKSTCGEKGGRCLIYDIETFRYKWVIHRFDGIELFMVWHAQFHLSSPHTHKKTRVIDFSSSSSSSNCSFDSRVDMLDCVLPLNWLRWQYSPSIGG